MAYGVDNAICICCFVTPKYQQSQYCEKELSYADSCKVPIIPCYMAEKEWKPTSWLGFIVHDLPRVNFRDANKTNISEKFEELLKKIESVVPQNDLEAAMDLEVSFVDNHHGDENLDSTIEKHDLNKAFPRTFIITTMKRATTLSGRCVIEKQIQ
ncbi:unnamed protein product [Rotaria sp. Silwood1]|nr:unnamed protein product [Rotaria sp. Silwood1]